MVMVVVAVKSSGWVSSGGGGIVGKNVDLSSNGFV